MSVIVRQTNPRMIDRLTDTSIYYNRPNYLLPPPIEAKAT